MSPDQINTVTNALVELSSITERHGPGFVAGAAATAICWAIRRYGPRISERRQTRRGLQRLQSYANHPGARRLLDDIHRQPREEEL